MKMTYTEAKRRAFARGTIPDGYFGKRASVEFALVGCRVVVVAGCGCFGAGVPDCQDVGEARWILEHHPAARNITITGRAGR